MQNVEKINDAKPLQVIFPINLNIQLNYPLLLFLIKSNNQKYHYICFHLVTEQTTSVQLLA